MQEESLDVEADELEEAGVSSDEATELVAGSVVIAIEGIDSCDDVDQQAISEGIARDILAASENIGQEPLAVTTYCQENDDGSAAGANAP